MKNPLRVFLYWTAGILAQLGLIDKVRGEQSVELAWPRIVTGLARNSQRTVDLLLVGIVLGSPAVAGLGFAYTYMFLVSGLSLGTAGGTISLVSQRYGADEYREIDLAVKQSIWIAIFMAIPLTIIYWQFADELIRLLGAASMTLQFGSTYLQLISLGFVFKFVNHIAGRALIGVDDAWTPMVFRVAGSGLNIVLNVILIFGLGLGVTGAAVGTLCATILVAGCFIWGFVGGSFPIIGDFPIQLRLEPPYVDWPLMRQLLDISFPLMIRRMGAGAARFPLIALVAQFGTVIVAAYTISRRVRTLMNAPNWGFGLATSSLVGQELGAGNELEAEAYGQDILRFSLTIFVLAGVFVGVFARPIARLFVQEPAAIVATVPFLWVVSISLIGLGIDGAATGTLRASGDTRWPMYGRLLGRYGAVPVAYFGTVTPTGVLALYLAMIVETYIPAAITFYRFRTGKWKAVSRSYRPDTTD